MVKMKYSHNWQRKCLYEFKLFWIYVIYEKIKDIDIGMYFESSVLKHPQLL